MSGENDEEFVPEEEAEAGPALIKKLRERLKKAVEEKQNLLDLLSLIFVMRQNQLFHQIFLLP